MTEQAQTLPQKSLTVQKRFISFIKHLEENELLNDIYSRDAIDALDRFSLWAGSLGALREPNSKLSIEYRLAEAPEIRNEIHRQLDYLLEAIDDVATVVQKRQANYELQEDEKDMEHFDGPGDTQAGPSEEIRMNLELISESLRMLFRIAVLVRKASPDNRFERAVNSSKCTFPPTFDIEHVKEKFSKLKAKEQSWLAERLGKAIAGRRQFIKYCRDHRDRLALDDDNIEAESATTVMQSSKATTLNPEKIRVHAATNFAVDDYEDEVVSILSISTTTDVLSTLALPRLADLSKDGEAFECPICFTLRSIKGERSWRLHAFHDLRPYSCTVGGAECDSLAFQDRNSWFQHELDCHKSQYECSLCDFFGTSDASHGRCWKKSSALQTKDESQSGETKGKSILVRTSQFKRHVAAHLEQLAIFAIPRAIEDDHGDERSCINSLGSTVADLSEPGEQEEPRTLGEEWLEGKLTDDENLPNINEEQDISHSRSGQYAENTDYPNSIPTGASTDLVSEALNHDRFEKPLLLPPTEALSRATLSPAPKEPSPPVLLPYPEEEHLLKELSESKNEQERAQEELKLQGLQKQFHQDTLTALAKRDQGSQRAEESATGISLQECVTSAANRRDDDAVFDENWLGKEGIFQGRSTLLLGKINDGDGVQVDVKTGDVIVLPAGTAHSSLRSSDDYRYIGVYPKECPKWTNEMGKRPPASFAQTIGAVATPQADPVYGKQGPVVSLWNAEPKAKL
ncbi:uncharacterized protein Triagg1_489 [Trichoderma aggressivum f. europaeum]|uniref:Oxidoreductase acuF-like C2H2 type zinc-finger domain-containing protein n=1 Tax=Trichoderma aggressivum f. europaeum TaxID=173218 RepID=A0AAE1INF7_9HYPO|nr:hypothetical protein Triagg1_489 [Trichoderma aggressivum f. europaeum]